MAELEQDSPPLRTVVVYRNRGGGVETWVDLYPNSMVICENGDRVVLPVLPSEEELEEWVLQGHTGS